MLTKVSLLNELGTQLEFPIFEESAPVPFTIREIQGLGPVKSDISTTSLAKRDGTRILSNRTPERNIVMQIGISPNYASGQSVQEVRHALYSSFIPGDKVTFTAYTSDGSRYLIDGKIEEVEPVLFTKDPTVQVSILCEDPYFRGPSAIVANGIQGTALTINYEGTAPTPFTFLLTATGAISTLNLRKSEGLGKYFYYDKALASGNKLEVNTTDGSKYVMKTVGTTVSNALNGWRTSSEWLKLTRGSNIFLLTTATGTATYKITYVPKFVGV